VYTLHVKKIVNIKNNYYFIYAIFVEFLDNRKNRGRWWDRWWCVHPACLIIIYAIFIEIIDNKKLEESDGVDDDVYILSRDML
jgi:hypothetical protein